MQYALMPPGVRQLVVRDLDNYPLKVDFLGKTGLLGFEAVDLLINNRIEFKIDDGQIASILAGHEAQVEAQQTAAAASTTAVETSGQGKEGQRAGIALLAVSALPVLYDVAKRVLRYLPKRDRV